MSIYIVHDITNDDDQHVIYIILYEIKMKKYKQNYIIYYNKSGGQVHVLFHKNMCHRQQSRTRLVIFIIILYYKIVTTNSVSIQSTSKMFVKVLFLNNCLKTFNNIHIRIYNVNERVPKNMNK